MKTRKVKMTLVRTDGGTQMRVEVDKALVTTYTEDLKNKAEFPPVDLFYDGKVYWLADGFHRFWAHSDYGAKTISANVHEGTQRDAILFAAGANAAHGLRRTNADKRRSVMALLEDEEWSQWSDRVIAKRCGVSHNFVSTQRPQLSSDDSCGYPIVTTGADGKKRKRPKNRRTRIPDLPHPDDIPEAEEDEGKSQEDVIETQPKPSGNKREVELAAREVVSTVQALLRLSPGVEHMEPLVNALDDVQTLCEEYMSA